MMVRKYCLRIAILSSLASTIDAQIIDNNAIVAPLLGTSNPPANTTTLHTSSVERRLMQAVWYPDWETPFAKASCINTSPVPETRPTFDSLLACCMSAYGKFY